MRTFPFYGPVGRTNSYRSNRLLTQVERLLQVAKNKTKFTILSISQEVNIKLEIYTHFGAHIVSIIQIGNEGSSIPIPMFAKVMAPLITGT